MNVFVLIPPVAEKPSSAAAPFAVDPLPEPTPCPSGSLAPSALNSSYRVSLSPDCQNPKSRAISVSALLSERGKADAEITSETSIMHGSSNLGEQHSRRFLSSCETSSESSSVPSDAYLMQAAKLLQYCENLKSNPIPFSAAPTTANLGEIRQKNTVPENVDASLPVKDASLPLLPLSHPFNVENKLLNSHSPRNLQPQHAWTQTGAPRAQNSSNGGGMKFTGVFLPRDGWNLAVMVEEKPNGSKEYFCYDSRIFDFKYSLSISEQNMLSLPEYQKAKNYQKQPVSGAQQSKNSSESLQFSSAPPQKRIFEGERYRKEGNGMMQKPVSNGFSQMERPPNYQPPQKSKTNDFKRDSSVKFSSGRPPIAVVEEPSVQKNVPPKKKDNSKSGGCLSEIRQAMLNRNEGETVDEFFEEKKKQVSQKDMSSSEVDSIFKRKNNNPQDTAKVDKKFSPFSSSNPENFEDVAAIAKYIKGLDLQQPVQPRENVSKKMPSSPLNAAEKERLNLVMSKLLQ